MTCLNVKNSKIVVPRIAVVEQVLFCKSVMILPEHAKNSRSLMKS